MIHPGLKLPALQTLHHARILLLRYHSDGGRMSMVGKVISLNKSSFLYIWMKCHLESRPFSLNCKCT